MLDHRTVVPLLREVIAEHPDDPAVARLLEATSGQRPAKTWEDVLPFTDLVRLAGRRRVKRLFGWKLPTRGGPPVAPPVGVDRLIAHCGAMPDRVLREDFADVVLVEATSDLDREQLRLYYAARTKHRTFKPKSLKDNNHRHIATTWQQQATTAITTEEVRSCRNCGKPLQGRQRETCSARCRKAHSRAQQA